MPIELFTADDGAHGRELWRTDGTTAATWMVSDLDPGSGDGNPQGFVVVDGLTYFSAFDGTTAELFRTDGTAGGTIALTSLGHGNNPSMLTAVGDRIFWTDLTGSAGAINTELFVSDGSVGGTTALASFTNASNVLALGDELIFTATDNAHGTELWISDGTVGGTHILDDIDPGVASASPGSLTLFDGEVYFTATDGAHGQQLWRTDGTTAGTQMFTNQGLAQGGVPLAVVNGMLLFAASDLNGDQVWATDGTAAGTIQLTQGNNGIQPNGGPPFDDEVVGGRLYFQGPFNGTTPSLFVTDGTAAGTKLVANIEGSALAQAGGGLILAGQQSGGADDLYVSDGTPAGLTAVASNVVVDSFATAGGSVFLEVSPVGGGDTQLWVSDGTAAGSKMLMDFQNGVIGGNSGPITAFGSDVLFSAPAPQVNGFTADQADNELWISDGTVAGTHELLNIDPPSTAGSLAIIQVQVSNGVGVPLAAALGDELVFAASVNGAYAYLMASNGTQAGTGLLTPHVFGQNIRFTAVGSEMFVAAGDASGIQLWATDGSLGHATQLTGAFDGFTTSDTLTFLTPFDGKLYFADAGALYVTDGTVAGTKLDVSLDVESQPVALAGEMVFYGFTSANGDGVYASNGAVGDLHFLGPASGLLAGIDPNPTFVVSGSKAFFALGTAASGDELWVTDGTAAGTQMVRDIAPGAANANPTQLTAFEGGVVFTASDGTDGQQVWFSDGTAAGTFQLILNPSGGANASQFTVADGQVFFSATDGGHGQELWTFNGSPGGAHMVTDLDPGAASSNPTDLLAFDGRLFFLADNGSGQALWSSDGTAGGTVEITTASNGGDPADLTVAGANLFFVGSDSTHGAGLFVTNGAAGGAHFLAGVSQATSLVAVGAELYFQATDATFGTELWKSDGTVAGTVRVTDTVLDNGSFPQNFSALPPAILPDNFNGDGRSDFLIENGSGAVVVGESGGGAAAYTAVAALGSEWTFHGNGDFLDDGKDDFLIQNAAGVVAVGEVAGGATTYSAVAALGSEWKFVGSGNLLDGGQHDQFLIENTSGAVDVGDVANGATTFTEVAALGPEWKFVGVGGYLGDGKDAFLIQNTSGAVVVGEVENGAAVYTAVAGLGPEWTFVGTGDFLGDGKDDFLIENTAGAVIAGEVMNGQASFTQLTALGPEWKFVGAGDYLGEGHDQFLIENTAGAVVIGDWSGGATHFTQVAALGPEWAFH